ncbi:MAG: PH domain-containing protein [Rikenellaceae bacterium]
MSSRKFIFFKLIDTPEELLPFIGENETIKFAAKTFRDVAVVTDKRLLIADKQGITGKKIEYYTIPYKSIVTYAVETVGTFDIDSEIKLVLTGGLEIELCFREDKILQKEKLFETYRAITDYLIK